MKTMTNEQLCTLAQQGDTQAQEQLVQNNLGYIRKTANELYISVGPVSYTHLDVYKRQQQFLMYFQGKHFFP